MDTPPAYDNTPALWLHHFPWPEREMHKHQRGHAVMQGGDIEHTGAIRLAAITALRAGTGLVTVLCNRDSLPVYAASCLAVMVREVENQKDFSAFLENTQPGAFLIGPAAGVNEATQSRVLEALRQGCPSVLDADALSVFATEPEPLFSAIHANTVLTPHEGEFSRLFATCNEVDKRADKLTRARQAAWESGAVVLLKGADTVIAAPDGRAVVSTIGTPWLATAGSGDVLAGIITGLMATGMDAFHAACVGAWLHGRSAELFGGAGLIAEDLPGMLSEVLQILWEEKRVYEQATHHT